MTIEYQNWNPFHRYSELNIEDIKKIEDIELALKSGRRLRADQLKWKREIAGWYAVYKTMPPDGIDGHRAKAGAKIEMAERHLHNAEIATKSLMRGLKTKKKGIEKLARKGVKANAKTWIPKFDTAWRAKHGVIQRADRYNEFIRYANEDKFLMRGDTADVLTTAHYITPHVLEEEGKEGKDGKKDIVQVGYRALTFDVDSELSVEDWNRIFPDVPPTFIIGSEITPGVFHRPHVWIDLEFPVFLDEREDKRNPYWRTDLARFERMQMVVAARLLNEGIKCDPGSKVLVKNPDCPRWSVYRGSDKLWRTKELEEALRIKKGVRIHQNRMTFKPLTEKPQTAEIIDFPLAKRVVDQHVKTQKLAQQADNKNTRIFNAVRVQVYEYCDIERERDEIYSYALELAIQAARNEGHVPSNDIRSIAKSIARFCAGKVFGRKINRGAAEDLMNGAESEHAKKSRGARYTHATQVQKTYNLIFEKRLELGEKANISSVASALGMSRNTVAKYWKMEDVSEASAIKKAEMLKSGVVLLSEKRTEAKAVKNVEQEYVEPVAVNASGQSVYPMPIADRNQYPAPSFRIVTISDDDDIESMMEASDRLLE